MSHNSSILLKNLYLFLKKDKIGKPKVPRKVKLNQLLSKLPGKDVLVLATFNRLKRYINKCEPADDIQKIFESMSYIPSKAIEYIKSAIEESERLDPKMK